MPTAPHALPPASLQSLCFQYLLKAHEFRYRLHHGLPLNLAPPAPVTIDSISAAADESVQEPAPAYPCPAYSRHPFFNPRAWCGITVESQLMTAALSRNLGVAAPYGAGYLPFDLFIFTRMRNYRVQVKYGSFARNAGWKISIRRRGNTRLYQKGDFNILACTGPNGVWYLIPWASLRGIRSLTIPNRERITDNCPSFPMKRFRERWDLFR
jgi:hypothetical protein